MLLKVSPVRAQASQFSHQGGDTKHVLLQHSAGLLSFRPDRAVSTQLEVLSQICIAWGGGFAILARHIVWLCFVLLSPPLRAPLTIQLPAIPPVDATKRDWYKNHDFCKPLNSPMYQPECCMWMEAMAWEYRHLHRMVCEGDVHFLCVNNK